MASPVRVSDGAFAYHMAVMTRETQLVLALCRTPLSASGGQRARDLITQGLDWDRVFITAENFEVEPVFFSNLKSLSDTGLPGDVFERAAIRERDSRAFALSRTLLLVDLYGKIAAGGIPLIVLKGPALGVMAYGGPSMRSYQDIDFLTTREALPRGRDRLLSLGYSRDYEPASEASLISGDHALEFSGPGGKIELHCALVERHLRLDLGERELWRDAVTIKIAGVEVSVLDPSRLLLFLCAHGTKYEWSRVRWICDVAQVANTLDSTQAHAVVALSRTANARRLLAIGLELAKQMLIQDLSRFPSDVLTFGGDVHAIVDNVRTRLGLLETSREGKRERSWVERVDPGARSLLFWARSRERWVDRAASIARVIFVPTDKDEGMGIFGWITRPLRLTARAARRSVSA